MKNGVCRPPSSFVNTYTSLSNWVCGVMLFGFAKTIPRSTSCFSTPRSNSPTLSPACPSSNSLRNISTPVPTTFLSVPNPTTPTSSPTLPSPPPPPPPPRDREHVLHRHQERLLHLPLRHRNALVQRRQQLLHLPHPRLVPRNRLQGRPPDDRNVVPRVLVLAQELAHLQLHQVQQLRVVHQVALVQEHDDRRHVHLPRQQNVLPRLRHRPVDGRDDQDRPVHLRRPRDHVLHVVGVPRAVHVRVVPVRRGVLHVRRRNRQDLRRIPPSLRFRRLRHLVVRHVGREPFVRRHLRQRRRQRRLPVVHVPNRAHVHMRLGPLKLCLGHESSKKNKYFELR